VADTRALAGEYVVGVMDSVEDGRWFEPEFLNPIRRQAVDCPAIQCKEAPVPIPE